MISYKDFLKESEDHKSDQVFKALAKLGWGGLKKNKDGSKTLEKTLKSSGTGGVLNPDGGKLVFAQYDAEGRYLELIAGFDMVFDMDTRDGDVTALAKAFDKRAVTEIKKHH